MEALRRNVWEAAPVLHLRLPHDALIAFFRQLVHRKSEAQARVVALTV
jgi:hypothetical protein